MGRFWHMEGGGSARIPDPGASGDNAAPAPAGDARAARLIRPGAAEYDGAPPGAI
jgi:hypothetical protein